MTSMKPTEAEFKKFWNILDKKQQQKRQQLHQPDLFSEHLEHSIRGNNATDKTH